MGKKNNLVTPRGRLVYPRLAGKPDTKFKPEGVWKTGLSVPKADAKELMEKIDAAIKAALDEAKKSAKNPKELKAIKQCDDKPYRIETDDDDNPTGNVLFNFKMTASGKSRKTGKDFTMQPALFGKSGSPLTAELAKTIGGGSVAKVSFEIAPFQQVKTGVGVSLRLQGVQILELVEWTGDGSRFGFSDESEEDEESAGEASEETASTDEESADEEGDDF